jgi:hypothetical protein
MLVGAALAGMTAGAGCAGSARVELIPLNYKTIDSASALTRPLGLDRCYWWTDESGQVWIAMQCERRPVFGKLGTFLYQMSLVLEKLPSGKQREYTVAERELRAVARFSGFESRFVSSAGVVALYREPGNRLVGSFRFLARREVSQLLGGWSPPTSYVMQGTFEAVHDEQRGRPIAEATESHGWDREPAGLQRGSAASTQPGAAGPPGHQPGESSW